MYSGRSSDGECFWGRRPSEESWLLSQPLKEMAAAKSTSGTAKFMNEKTGTGAAEYLGLN
jgi:hypothetical protein